MKLAFTKQLLIQVKNSYQTITPHFEQTRRYWWRELQFFTDYIKPKDKVLDVGCGNGRLLEVLQEKKVNYTGIDNCAELIKIAKNKYQAKFLVGDILQLPFPDNSFDKIFCIAVLQHLPSKKLRQQAGRELKRVLKPNGLLLVTVWNVWRQRRALIIKYFLKKIFCFSQLDFGDIFIPWRNSQRKILTQRYIHAFTLRELKRLFRRVGLTIIKFGQRKKFKSESSSFYLIGRKTIK